MTATARHRVIFQNVRPMGGPGCDLLVVDGAVAADGPSPGPAEVVDCAGLIALPTLVDAHIHPDKTTWGEKWATRKPVPRGLPDYVEQDAELYRRLATPLAERARRLMT